MRSESIKFMNSEGITLDGKIDFPISGHPKAYALFAHCFTCSKNLHAVSNISLALTQHNIAVFRFDFTGLARSGGSFEDSNFSSNVQDLIDAYSYLKDNFHATEIIIGHSLGGAAVLSAADRMPESRAVVTIGSPAEPMHVRKVIKSNEEEILTKGYAQVSIGGRPFIVKKQFIEDLEQSDQKQHIRNLDKGLLIMHSPQDTIVEIDNASRIYELAHHPKSFITLDGADHLLSEKRDSLYAGSVIASWSERYLDIETQPDLSTDKQVIVRTGEKGYTTEIKSGHHYMVADEPQEVGGKDLGPTPYGYLNAALGACTSMTLRMYADHKKWDLREVRVHLSHAKDHIKDSHEPEDKNKKIDVIEREIELEGNLDEFQRSRLLEIADRCPVHKTLHSDIRVKTKLLDHTHTI